MNTGEVAAWSFALARSSGLVLGALAWSGPMVGTRARALVALALAWGTAGALGRVEAPREGWGWALALGAEGLTGAGLGWTVSLVVGAAKQAGDWVANLAGLTPDQWLGMGDSEGQTPLGQIYGWVALLAFLGLDGPLALAVGLMESYQSVPPGGLVLDGGTAMGALDALGRALALAVRLAAPAALALIAAGGALGLLGRAGPSVTALALTMPLRVALGLVVAGLGLGTVAFAVAGAF